LGLIDLPGGRKKHEIPTPLIGGLGIYLGVLSMAMLTPGVFEQYAGLLAITSIVLIIGIVDDAYELNVYFRMAVHSLCALIMAVAMDNQLLSLGNILGLGLVSLGFLAIPLTIFATVGVINAVNMTDGMDGLSGGLVMMALIFLSIVAFTHSDIAMLQMLTLFICAILAFLAFNFRLPWNKSAALYLGDAGSTMLGFIVAWFLIEATQGEGAMMSPVYALWFLAVPLIDTVNLLVRRPMRGVSPFRAGTDHIHHRLHRAGYSHKQIVIGLYATAIAFGSIGMTGYLLEANEAVMFALFLGIFAIYILWSKLFKQYFVPSVIAAKNTAEHS
jgi:UDP-GlcNAc:undecaprenyl-phosphate GlcNAc-1-phosphate transferase